MPAMNPTAVGASDARRVFAYGFLGLPLAFAALPIYVHVPRYYADSAGLPLALLGALLLGARLFDAAIDPWLGWLADRMPRRRMVAMALVPFLLGFVALLNPPETWVPLWLVASLALTYVGFSAASVAYQAWGADAGSDSRERTLLTAAREGFGLAGVVLAAALPGLLATDLSEGVARLSWVLPPVLLLAAIVLFAGIDSSAARSSVAVPLRSSLRHVLGDVPFRRLLAVFVANGMASALPATLFLFFVADVLRAESVGGPLLALYFVAGAASLPGWVRLAAKTGRVIAWLVAMVLAIVAFGGAVFLGPGDVLAFALICVASGLALGADLALPAAMAADMGERLRQAGACFGVWNFLGKLNLALAAGFALPLLALFGYQPGSGAAGEGLVALSLVYGLLPLTFKLLASVLLWRWRHLLNSLEVRS